MSKFFYIDDVGKIMDDKIMNLMNAVVDDDTPDEEIVPAVKTIRQYQEFAIMVLDEMEKQNEAYEKDMAEWKARQEAEKNATAS